MEWVETTGRTVEDAKDLALDRLGVDEADAEFEVLEQPRPGLFGRLRGEARVRARVRPTQPRPKVERRERKRRTPEARNESTSTTARGGGNQQKQEQHVSDERSDADLTRTGNGQADMAGAATDFLVGLAGAFGSQASAEVHRDDNGDIEVRLRGDDLGLMIGPRGQTLQAVQDLTRMAVQRLDDDRQTRLRIDIAGYRERRREALSRFTEQVVSQVLASGQPRALEPMSAADRKVVHDVATTLDGVTTRSEGEEPFRRVVILPVDA